MGWRPGDLIRVVDGDYRRGETFEVVRQFGAVVKVTDGFNYETFPTWALDAV